jgi:hypothetical protein
MEKLSRRTVLTAGGALGALAALAPARPVWAWSSSRSIAGGDLATMPPEDVWDAEADAVVRRLFVEEGIGGIDALNALLRPWHRNDQPLPAGLPADLVAFIEGARRAPGWIDRGKLADAYAFYELRGGYTGLLYGLGSGIMSCAIPDEARAVYHSKGGEDMRDRVTKTAKLGYDIGTRNAFAPDGEMIVTCIKTRLAHAGVRHLITTSSRWQAGGDIPAPISQRDLIITWHSLATFIHRTLGAWRVPVTHRHSEGFLHVWQVTAHFLGIEDVYIPATWTDARYQSDQTLDPVIAPTPEGIALAEILLGLVAEIDQGVTRPALDAMARYMCGSTNAGLSIADMLEIPADRTWDTGVERGWPLYVAAREIGAGLPLTNHVYWTFDELLRLGVLWGLNRGPGPIHIQIPTANRSEASYPPGY